MNEPIEIEGWTVTGAEAEAATGDNSTTITAGPQWSVDILQMDARNGGLAYVPEAVVAALLRARGWTVVEPGSAPLPDGFYVVSGLPAEYGHHWRVLTHRDESNDGQPYVCAWGLSLWAREGEEPTWRYRTFGNRLSVLRERFPQATWAPDRDRVPEMQIVLEHQRLPKEQP